MPAISYRCPDEHPFCTRMSSTSTRKTRPSPLENENSRLTTRLLLSRSRKPTSSRTPSCPAFRPSIFIQDKSPRKYFKGRARDCPTVATKQSRWEDVYDLASHPLYASECHQLAKTESSPVNMGTSLWVPSSTAGGARLRGGFHGTCRVKGVAIRRRLDRTGFSKFNRPERHGGGPRRLRLLPAVQEG